MKVEQLYFPPLAAVLADGNGLILEFRFCRSPAPQESGKKNTRHCACSF
ncbi:MAG TPA: hypothetical protein PK629_04480 [Oscillospiraceae bacterium]|nr:hypothetical protein [Oscillospiraceae bacterium]HPK35127.1 hypothetical protein [Oscillospiraceae bacterium]HPR74930.1 hypothetical protein [Oscillospiraceae bacterium]